MKPNSLSTNTTLKQNKRHYRLMAISGLVLIAIGLYQLWVLWPSMLVASVQWQREVNEYLADLLYDVQSNPFIAGGSLIGFSFLYGMLHSLGPGHGKVIVTAYVATHPTKVKVSLMLTIISAICQAVVAIVLVAVLVWGFNASMRMVTEKAMLFVSLSFVLVVVLGGFISGKALKQIFRSIRRPKLQVTRITAFSEAKISGASLLKSKPIGYSSAHHTTEYRTFIHSLPRAGQSSECGCGHRHVADASVMNSASTLKEYIGIVASVGIRPCSGAIMVLLFANMAGLFWVGVLSALVMAIGTAFTTSLIAIMTLSGKRVIKRYLIVAEGRHMMMLSIAGYYIQLMGGLVLVVVGLILLSSQDYGISPIF